MYWDEEIREILKYTIPNDDEVISPFPIPATLDTPNWVRHPNQISEGYRYNIDTMLGMMLYG